jgi:hypothetical protein
MTPTQPAASSSACMGPYLSVIADALGCGGARVSTRGGGSAMVVSGRRCGQRLVTHRELLHWRAHADQRAGGHCLEADSGVVWARTQAGSAVVRRLPWRRSTQLHSVRRISPWIRFASTTATCGFVRQALRPPSSGGATYMRHPHNQHFIGDDFSTGGRGA